MRADDMAQVVHLSDEVHPGLPERLSTLQQRLLVYPRGCIVLVEDRVIQGYAFSHPILRGLPPALDTAPASITDAATQFYIHDFVVSPEVRGAGHARSGVDKLLSIGAPYDTVALISVYGTADFWRRFGFQESALPDPDKLLSYGPDAVFMVRPRKAG
jgi:ribosomal protein S18 acetylase RimI-like enzyme